MSWDEIADLSKSDKRFIAACHAMQGLLADSNIVFSKDVVAASAVGYADALIAELEKK